MDANQTLRRLNGSMPPRNPKADRYVVEIRDAAGTSLLLTSADWTAEEGDLAISTVLRLVSMKAAAPAKRQGNKPRSVDQAPEQRRRGRLEWPFHNQPSCLWVCQIEQTRHADI